MNAHYTIIVALRAVASAIAVGLIAGLPTATGAPPESSEPDAAGIDFFEKNIRPLLVDHCYECHAGDEKEGGLQVDSRAALIKGGDSGPAVVAGKPDQSRLVEAVTYKNPDLQMPPDNRLPDADIAKIRRWVAMGAPDPRRASPDTTSDKQPAPSRDWWSFRPVAPVIPPPVNNTAWVRTPIDAFVLHRLEAAGLEPAPPADKRTLIRRVTFDLTGLPPTREEIAAFLADDSPSAYDRLVERLLESPHYGERWGRHWLDVARYADSNGLDENLAFGNAWRYRDYVVQSFNDDKPFARFLVEQLAGDLLPDADRQTRTATGFLALGAKVLAEPDEEKLRMDTIDEQIDTTGKVWLGIALGCARCHDHKFDPVTQADYYALAAIFKSTRTFADSKTGVIHHWYEHSFADAEERERLKKIDAEIAAKKKAAASFKSKATAELRSQARQHAVDYLVAAAQLSPTATLTQVAAVAKPLGLHPRILHHARLHLEYNRDDAVLAAWHDAAKRHDADAIRKHYTDLFHQVEQAWQAAKKSDPKTTALKDKELEAARQLLDDPTGLLAVPPKPEFAFDSETLAQYYELMEVARQVESRAPDETAAMGVCDDQVCPKLAIHIRGSHRNLGRLVERAVPSALGGDVPAPRFPADHSGRLELARWLADPRHPLTARVYVNRVWGWHFGQPIVATTENFGHLGARPTHPDLLDFLASIFVESGGSTKMLHRMIVRSNTYRMDSVHPQQAEGKARDAANRLLWHFPIRRLDAESIRDAMLAISGELDLTVGGKTIPLRNRQFVFNHTSVDHTKYDSRRRALYLPVIRNHLYPFFEQFNFPDPTMPTGHRDTTVVAPQALWMMNSPLVLETADQWAAQLLGAADNDPARVQIAYEAAVGRLPSPDETQRILAALDTFLSAEDVGEGVDRQLRAWSLVCQSLFASNEFIYVR